jgi:putative FmdB family regulatory protein
MYILNDFRCRACGKTFESLEKSHVVEVTCVACGDTADRLVAAPHLDYIHMGLDPVGNPTAADKWAAMHEKGARNRGGE